MNGCGRTREDGSCAGRPPAAAAGLQLGASARADARARSREPPARADALFGRVRRIFLELGRRLHAVDVLDDPRDVLYLEVDEVLAFVDGRATTADLRGLAAVRRAEFSRYEREPAPDDRFETRGLSTRAMTFAAPRRSRRRRRRAPRPRLLARHRSRRRPSRVDPARRSSAALDSRRGAYRSGLDHDFSRGARCARRARSLLSHAAIVARELGNPAIVSFPGLTRWLNDGDLVELDGTRRHHPEADPTGVLRAKHAQ